MTLPELNKVADLPQDTATHEGAASRGALRISVIGCGYLGAVHDACMAALGHEVIGIDVDARKVEALAAGRPPFYEPELPELLSETVATGRLQFSSDISDAAAGLKYRTPRDR